MPFFTSRSYKASGISFRGTHLISGHVDQKDDFGNRITIEDEIQDWFIEDFGYRKHVLVANQDC